MHFVDSLPREHLRNPEARPDGHRPLPARPLRIRAPLPLQLRAALARGIGVPGGQLAKQRHRGRELRIGDRDHVEGTVLAAEHQREAGRTASQSAQSGVHAQRSDPAAVAHAEDAQLAMPGVIISHVGVRAREEARVLEHALRDLKEEASGYF